jgi:hypothetical protein
VAIKSDELDASFTSQMIPYFTGRNQGRSLRWEMIDAKADGWEGHVAQRVGSSEIKGLSLAGSEEIILSGLPAGYR